MQRLTAAHDSPPESRGVRRRLPLSARLSARPDRHEAAELRRETRFGLLGCAGLAVLLAVTGAIYLVPLGKSTYTAELTEARTVRAGDEIRVAGIRVGTVDSLELLPDRVRMRFTVRDDVFLGDQTTLDIRMLTVVGGHYVAAHPAGDKPLGATVIPADHVRLPYSLVRTLQDAAAPVAQVDGDTLRRNLAALQGSLADNPDALRRMGNALEGLVDILNRQNADISRSLTVLDEYLTSVNENRSLLGTFVREIGLLETMGLDKQAEIKESLRIAAELLSRISALDPAWREQLQPMVDKLMEALPQLKSVAAGLADAIGGIADLRERLQAAVRPASGIVLDQSDVTLDGPSVCVPVPGRGCGS
ncbi:MlaD family protein [Nocardia brasiliensis]